MRGLSITGCQRKAFGCKAAAGPGCKGVGRAWRAQTPVAVRCANPDIEISVADLEAQLQIAISSEDYDVAARLRDQITNAMHDQRVAVEYANSKFYEAFEKGDLEGMRDIWGDGEHVQCIHPASGCIAGRDDVMESWATVLAGAKRGLLSIRVQDVRTFARDTLAYVTCVELVESGDTRGKIVATNVFEKQRGRWKIVNHHGSQAPF